MIQAVYFRIVYTVGGSLCSSQTHGNSTSTRPTKDISVVTKIIIAIIMVLEASYFDFNNIFCGCVSYGSFCKICLESEWHIFPRKL